MEGIRNWLVACGATFGCKEVHHYRWPDAEARPEVPYITYRATHLEEETKAIRGEKRSGVDGEDPYTVLSDSHGAYRATVQIDLYNSEYGLGWLAKCAVAAEKEQAIKNIFLRTNVGYKKIITIDDMTEEDDERIYYHQRMIVVMRTTITHTHKNLNFKVETVDSSGATTYDTE